MGNKISPVLGTVIGDANDCKGLCKVFRKAKKHRLKIADVALLSSFLAVSQIYTSPNIPLNKPIHALIQNMQVFEGPAERNFGRFLAAKYGFGNKELFDPEPKSKDLELPEANAYASNESRNIKTPVPGSI